MSQKIEMAGLNPNDNAIVKNLSDFRNALGIAKMKSEDLEVCTDVFNYICNGAKTPTIWYEGVQVYREGTRTELKKIDRMTLDQRAKMLAEEWRAANPDLI